MSRDVLLIHGAFTTGACWSEFARALKARGFNPIAPTLRHHGLPADSRLADLSLRDYRADLLRLIDRLDGPPAIIGHSLGGLLAQMLAAEGKASTAVLLGTATPWGILPETQDQLAAAFGLMHIHDFWSRRIEPVYEIAANHTLDLLDEASRRRAFELFVPESGRVLWETIFWGFDPTQASAVDADRIDCRMLALTGSEDRVCPPSTLDPLARKYSPLLAIETVEGFGHWLIGEPGWERIAKAAADWIEETVY